METITITIEVPVDRSPLTRSGHPAECLDDEARLAALRVEATARGLEPVLQLVAKQAAAARDSIARCLDNVGADDELRDDMWAGSVDAQVFGSLERLSSLLVVEPAPYPTAVGTHG
jgi:hypothetical protein